MIDSVIKTLRLRWRMFWALRRWRREVDAELARFDASIGRYESVEQFARDRQRLFVEQVRRLLAEAIAQQLIERLRLMPKYRWPEIYEPPSRKKYATGGMVQPSKPWPRR